MKTEQIIGNYCRLYKTDAPTIGAYQTEYFVTINLLEARVLPYHCSAALGRVVCEAMKRGTVLYVRNGIVTPLSWGHWKKFWSDKFEAKPKKKKKALPSPCYEKKKERSIFDEMLPTRSRKKCRGSGFERTYNAFVNTNRMGTPIPSKPL